MYAVMWFAGHNSNMLLSVLTKLAHLHLVIDLLPYTRQFLIRMLSFQDLYYRAIFFTSQQTLATIRDRPVIWSVCILQGGQF